MTGSYATNHSPKKLERIFRRLLIESEGSICVFTDLNAIDIKQRTYTYHHQKYMLQFQQSSKVHRLNSKGENFHQYAFNFCPFVMLPTKDTPSKPLIGTKCYLTFL
jgi:hypothetical protein